MRAKWSAPIRKYWKISEQIDPDTLMGFSPRMQSTDAVFSENAPIDYQVNDKAKMEYFHLTPHFSIILKRICFNNFDNLLGLLLQMICSSLVTSCRKSILQNNLIDFMPL